MTNIGIPCPSYEEISVGSAGLCCTFVPCFFLGHMHDHPMSSYKKSWMWTWSRYPKASVPPPFNVIGGTYFLDTGVRSQTLKWALSPDPGRHAGVSRANNASCSTQGQYAGTFFPAPHSPDFKIWMQEPTLCGCIVRIASRIPWACGKCGKCGCALVFVPASLMALLHGISNDIP